MNGITIFNPICTAVISKYFYCYQLWLNFNSFYNFEDIYCVSGYSDAVLKQIKVPTLRFTLVTTRLIWILHVSGVIQACLWSRYFHSQQQGLLQTEGDIF